MKKETSTSKAFVVDGILACKPPVNSSGVERNIGVLLVARRPAGADPALRVHPASLRRCLNRDAVVPDGDKSGLERRRGTNRIEDP